MAYLRQAIPESVPFPTDLENEQMFSDFLSGFDKYEGEFRELFENEQRYLLINDEIKDEIQLSPSEIHIVTRDVINNINIKETLMETEVESIIDIGNQAQDTVQFLETLDFTCEDCVTHETVSNFNQIRAGDHIRFHRCFLGINLYNHHAIVTRVQTDPPEPTVGEMTLVHFQKTETWDKTVIRETKRFDLKSEKIDVVRYLTEPFPRADIINRANKMADKFEKRKQEEAYSVLSNSCEDKSNEIASGMKYGHQINSLSAYVKSVISWVLKVILKFAIRCCDKMKPYIRGFANIAVIASLLSIVDQLMSLRWKKDQGILCLKCFDREYNKLMSSLIFCLISIGVSVTFHVSWLYYGISTATALAIPCVSSLLIDTIMPIIQPAANVPKPVVRRGNMIKVGDVITFPYVGLFHEGVVVGKTSSSSQVQNVTKVTIVHFNYPGMFGTRTVVKEDFYFDLKKKSVYVYDFSGESVLPPEEVVERAMDQIGSQDFSAFQNRSSHIAWHCKTGRRQIKELPFIKAKKIEEISPGDVINFTYCWLPHDAVVVQVQYPETVACDVIHYNYAGLTGTRTIVEENFTFELADQNVFVHDYSGHDTFDADDVVARARSRLGEQSFNTFTNRSSHLAKWCKIKKKPHVE